MIPPGGPVTPPTPGPLPPQIYDLSPTQPFPLDAELALDVLPGQQSNGSPISAFRYPTSERLSVLAGLPDLEDMLNPEQLSMVEQYMEATSAYFTETGVLIDPELVTPPAALDTTPSQPPLSTAFHAALERIPTP